MVRLTKLLLLIISALFTTALPAQDGFSVITIKFNGNKNISAETLAKQMNTTPAKFPEKLIFWKKSAKFSSYTFEEDLIRLNKFYQRNGFPDPEITWKAETENNKEKLIITINITEGEPVMIHSVNFAFAESSHASDILDSVKKIFIFRNSLRGNLKWSD